MVQFKNDKSLLRGKGEGDVQWVTINGAHIPIKDGENVGQALNNISKTKSRRYLTLPKKEYAELCSAIRTKYADKIPKQRGILYKNHYYVYNYDKSTEKILFIDKLAIIGNEEIIKRMEEKYVK